MDSSDYANVDHRGPRAHTDLDENRGVSIYTTASSQLAANEYGTLVVVRQVYSLDYIP